MARCAEGNEEASLHTIGAMGAATGVIIGAVTTVAVSHPHRPLNSFLHHFDPLNDFLVSLTASNARGDEGEESEREEDGYGNLEVIQTRRAIPQGLPKARRVARVRLDSVVITT